jgi:hypothetical protein
MKKLISLIWLASTLNLFAAFPPPILRNVASTNAINGNRTVPFWINVKDPPYNAVGNSNANDTAAIQSALSAVTSSNGAIVYFPKGTYLHDGLTVSKDRVQIVGDGYGTILKRRASGTTDALLVTGQQFQMRNLRMEAALNLATNVNSSLCLTNLSDSTVENVWFFGDWDQVKVFYGNNHRFKNNIFEASQHNGAWFYQSFLDLVSGNAFYTMGNGVDDGGTNITSGVLIQNDPAYSFHPYGTVISDNVFRKGLFAHGVFLTNANNMLIEGNVFNLSGTFNPGTKDDIRLAGVTNVIVFGNTSTGTNNDYIPGNRATRYVVNTDASSDFVKIWGNSFQAGISGVVNPLAKHIEWQDSSGNWMVNTANIVANYNFVGSVVVGPSQFMTFTDGGGVGIFQQNNHDWEWFDQGTSKIPMYLAVGGELRLGTASSLSGKFTLASSASANKQSFSPASVPASTINFILPSADPTAGQVLAASAPAGGNVTLTWTAAVGTTYNPTFFNVANLDSLPTAASTWQYQRVGNTVTVAGEMSIDPTLTATTTIAGISLPIASNLTATGDCAGTGCSPGIVGQVMAVRGETVNDRAELIWKSSDVTAQTTYVHFTYIVK